MSQINDATLYVFYDNDGVFKDFTLDAWSKDPSKFFKFSLGTNQALYIGKEYTFNFRYFNFKTPKAGANIKYEYSTKSGLHPVANLVDNTFNFSKSAHVYYSLPNDWVKTTINGKSLFWLKITDLELTVDFELVTIKNIFSDDSMVEDFLPNLSRYLPVGKSDFLYLHELAKNEIMNDMKAGSRIDYEDQIKDDSIIVLQQLSCYKFLELLLLPMIEDDSIRTMQGHFGSLYLRRLDSVRLSIDSNKDNKISEGERGKVTFSTITRY